MTIEDQTRGFAGTLVLLVLLGLVLTLSSGAALEAQGALTLEEAIAVAEEHNHELAAAAARLDAAVAGTREARSFRLPEVRLEGGYQRTDNPVFVFSNLLGQESFTQDNFAVDSLNRPAALDHWRARLVVEQPLWTGGRLATGELAARQLRDAAAATHDRARQEIVREVAEAYASAVLAERRLAVANESLAAAAANVGLVRDLYEGGLVVESDLLLARVRASEVREMLIGAASELELSRAALNLAMGRDLEAALRLPDDLAPAPPQREDLATLIGRARVRRSDLAAARARGAAASTGVETVRAERRPTIGLEAAFEANAEDFFGADGDNTSLAIGFEVPLWNGGRTRARIERARARAREADSARAQLAKGIDLEVRRAWHGVGTARARLEQAEIGAQLARRSLEIVADRYREGLITLPELLDGETALTSARMRRVAARRDLLLAQFELELATGDL